MWYWFALLSSSKLALRSFVPDQDRESSCREEFSSDKIRIEPSHPLNGYCQMFPGSADQSLASSAAFLLLNSSSVRIPLAFRAPSRSSAS
jgi:hypothetical protein